MARRKCHANLSTLLAARSAKTLSNAIKYRGGEKPRIHIDVAAKGSQWLFSVRDNGIGIESAHHERIFGIFKRLHGKDYEGTGLGLTICKKIAEKYKGEIIAQSRPGEGAVFTLKWPA